MVKSLSYLCAASFCWGLVSSLAAAEEIRAYQHGLDIIQPVPGKYFAIWASSGTPPHGPRIDGEWTHDIYVAPLDGRTPQLRPRLLISAPLAQEPASAAVNANGNIFVTMEDAWRADRELLQSYAVFSRNFRPIRPYQSVVMEGGHSGHVAATDKGFGVFFSEGWIDGGGVDNLGSGDDVWLSLFTADGRPKARIAVSVGNANRDWWPLIAGSHDRYLLVWQRFVPGRRDASLMMQLFDPVRERWTKGGTLLSSRVGYYSYDVQFLPGLDAFLVTGNKVAGRGFAVLLGNNGRILARKSGLPRFVREAQPAIRMVREGTSEVVYPTGQDQLTILHVTRNRLSHLKNLKTGQRWSTAGTDGFFTATGGLFFLTLAKNGVRVVRVLASDM